VIDYGIENEKVRERAEEFRMGERIESGHLPVEISIEKTNHEEKGKEERKRSRGR
jgi:hypothetical protein